MKVFFHVINSVKGGSGKSTFSLLLANYYSHCKSEAAYIIDLDIQGTSWKKNFNQFFENDAGEEPIYINDLMYDFSNGITKNFIWNLKICSKNEPPYVPCWTIPLCIANPTNNDINEVELDLFENAIRKLIVHLIQKETAKNSEIIHIVFDMPPSKEKHAERILNHLLLDNKIHFKDLHSGYVCLYMISAITPAHIELNVEYIKNLVLNRSYSNIIVDLINSDSDKGGFQLFAIANDTSGVLPPKRENDIHENIVNALKTSYKKIQFTEDDEKKKFKHFKLLQHLSFTHDKQIVEIVSNMGNNSDCLIIMEDTIGLFENCLKDKET